MAHRVFACVPVALAAVAFGQADPPAAGYQLIDVGPANGFITGAPGLNDLGQVTFGSGESGVSGGVWTAGVGRRLPNADGALPVRINNRGDVVGQPELGRPAAWIDGSAVNLDQATGLSRTAGIDINDSRQILFTRTGVGEERSYIYDVDTGAVTDVGTFGLFAVGGVITESGQVAGYSRYSGGATRAFIWEAGVMRELAPSFSPSVSTFAYDMNEHGVAVGTVDQLQAAIFRDGQVTLLPNPGDHNLIRATALNDDELIVGFKRRTVGGFRAVIWDSMGVHDLSDFVVNADGWVLETASDVNENGWISGHGVRNGLHRSFVLVPIPGPGSIGVGMIAGVILRRRR